MMAVLRVGGEGFDVAGFLDAHPRIRSKAAVWPKRKARSTSRTANTSGFNLMLADGENWERVRDASVRSVTRLVPVVAEAKRQGAEVELDISIEAMETGMFTVSGRLSPADMAALSGAGVTFRVTVYPASSEPPEGPGSGR